MSSNPILSNINAIMPQNNQATSVIESYDLSDDRFANILEERADKKDDKFSFEQEDIMSKLGVPFGIDIEGFDYNELLAQTVSSTDKVDAINTDSNINNESKFNLSSLVKNAIEDFAPVVGSVLESGITPDTVGKTAKALKSFWGSQAQSIYSTMNKESVENITDAGKIPFLSLPSLSP